METQVKYNTKAAVLKLLASEIMSIPKHLPYSNQNRPPPKVQCRSRRKPTLTLRLDTKR